MSAQHTPEVAAQIRDALDRHDAALIALLEEPTQEMLEAFQEGFRKQLSRRKHKGGESAELGGIRALLLVALGAAISKATGSAS